MTGLAVLGQDSYYPIPDTYAVQGTNHTWTRMAFVIGTTRYISVPFTVPASGKVYVVGQSGTRNNGGDFANVNYWALHDVNFALIPGSERRLERNAQHKGTHIYDHFLEGLTPGASYTVRLYWRMDGSSAITTAVAGGVFATASQDDHGSTSLTVFGITEYAVPPGTITSLVTT